MRQRAIRYGVVVAGLLAGIFAPVRRFPPGSWPSPTPSIRMLSPVSPAQRSEDESPPLCPGWFVQEFGQNLNKTRLPPSLLNPETGPLEFLPGTGGGPEDPPAGHQSQITLPTWTDSDPFNAPDLPDIDPGDTAGAGPPLLPVPTNDPAPEPSPEPSLPGLPEPAPDPRSLVA